MEFDRRKKQYELLSDISRDLLNEIYGNKEGFIKAQFLDTSDHKRLLISSEPHPLEEYIVSYDNSMEEDGIIINIGERIGFNIAIDETNAYQPIEQFYDRCSYTIRHNSPSRIEKIMDMNKGEYKEFLEKLGHKYTDEIYYDRLNVDSNRYSEDLLQSYYSLEDVVETPEDDLTLYDEGIVNNLAQVSSTVDDNEYDDEYDDIKEDEIDDYTRETYTKEGTIIIENELDNQEEEPDDENDEEDDER